MSRTARRRLLLALALPALTGAAATWGCDSGRPEPDPNGSGSEGLGFDAEAELGAWVELWATYDLERVDDLFLDDPRLTYFSSETEGLMVGPAAIRTHHEGFDFVEGGRAPGQELWVEEIHVSEFGRVAVVGATWHFGDRAMPDEASRGPMTVVYVDEGHGPKIAHMHFADY
jgi:ketosteroid isomerase-like protein